MWDVRSEMWDLGSYSIQKSKKGGRSFSRSPALREFTLQILRKHVAVATSKAAARIRTNDVDGVDAAAGAAWERLDIGRSEVRLRHRCTGVKLRFHRILLLRRIDLLEVCDTAVLPARGSRLNKVRNRDSHQDADDQHDDHDFDKGEALGFANNFHSISRPWLAQRC